MAVCLVTVVPGYVMRGFSPLWDGHICIVDHCSQYKDIVLRLLASWNVNFPKQLTTVPQQIWIVFKKGNIDIACHKLVVGCRAQVSRILESTYLTL